MNATQKSGQTGQHYTSRYVEGPRALEAAEEFAQLASKQAGIEFPVLEIDGTSARIDLDDWAAEEAFGPWFKEWALRWDLNIYD